MTEFQVWRTANRLFGEYGSEASLIAAKKANELFNASAPDAANDWVRVCAAIVELECGALLEVK